MLGYVPIANAGDIGGYYCHSHGSNRMHLAGSGRDLCLSTLKFAPINSPVKIQLLLETWIQGTSFFSHHSKKSYLRTSFLYLKSVQFSSVAQLCPTLCDLMDCSTPGLSVHHQCSEFTQTHVHWVGDAIQHLILCHRPPLLPSIFPRIGVFSNGSVLCIRWPNY